MYAVKMCQWMAGEIYYRRPGQEGAYHPEDRSPSIRLLASLGRYAKYFQVSKIRA
jgi:hypothetical protein